MRPYFCSVLVMLCLFCTFAFAADGILPGSGTEADPYLIEDLDDFDAFADPCNALTYWAYGVHTKLMVDIDLSGRIYTTAVIAPDTDNANSSWIFDGPAFSGSFNGNGYVISNLTIDTGGAGNEFLGTFGCIDQAGIVINLDLRQGCPRRNIVFGVVTCLTRAGVVGTVITGNSEIQRVRLDPAGLLAMSADAFLLDFRKGLKMDCKSLFYKEGFADLGVPRVKLTACSSERSPISPDRSVFRSSTNPMAIV